MLEIALTTFMILCTVGIFENILGINGAYTRHYSDSQYGICIVLDIAWIIICAVALYVGGAFASAAITVATVWLIIGILGDICTIVKYESISDAIGLAIHIALLIMFLSIGD